MLATLRSSLEPVVWWTARRVFTVHDVGGLAFIDVRGSDAGPEALLARLHAAVAYIHPTRFRTLVHAEVAFVAATRHPRGSISVRVRALMGPFETEAQTNPFAIACKLVWAAGYIHFNRAAARSGRARDEATIRKRCNALQLRFVDAVPGAEAWAEYLRADHRASIDPTPLDQG